MTRARPRTWNSSGFAGSWWEWRADRPSEVMSAAFADPPRATVSSVPSTIATDIGWIRGARSPLTVARSPVPCPDRSRMARPRAAISGSAASRSAQLAPSGWCGISGGCGYGASPSREPAADGVGAAIGGVRPEPVAGVRAEHGGGAAEQGEDGGDRDEDEEGVHLD